jgi:hypothetical protein
MSVCTGFASPRAVVRRPFLLPPHARAVPLPVAMVCHTVKPVGTPEAMRRRVEAAAVTAVAQGVPKCTEENCGSAYRPPGINRYPTAADAYRAAFEAFTHRTASYPGRIDDR